MNEETKLSIPQRRFNEMKEFHQKGGVFVVLRECEGEPDIPHHEIWILKDQIIPPFVTPKTLASYSEMSRKERRYVRQKSVKK